MSIRRPIPAHATWRSATPRGGSRAKARSGRFTGADAPMINPHKFGCLMSLEKGCGENLRGRSWLRLLSDRRMFRRIKTVPKVVNRRPGNRKHGLIWNSH